METNPTLNCKQKRRWRRCSVPRSNHPNLEAFAPLWVHIMTLRMEVSTGPWHPASPLNLRLHREVPQMEWKINRNQENTFLTDQIRLSKPMFFRDISHLQNHHFYGLYEASPAMVGLWQPPGTPWLQPFGASPRHHGPLRGGTPPQALVGSAIGDLGDLEMAIFFP